MAGIILATGDTGYNREQNRSSPLPSGVLLWRVYTHKHTPYTTLNTLEPASQDVEQNVDRLVLLLGQDPLSS